MSKKKRFGISEAMTRGLTETINVVENNQGMFRNVVLPLSRIELDPDNPRKLALNLRDVRGFVQTDDPLYQRKQDELERLKELAHTIKSNGVINPIVVYKLGEVYRVVAGERRCLASILAGKQEIEARVFQEKPKGFELKLIQWVENTAREDLTLDERLGNVRDIIEEYIKQNGKTEVTATLLKNITGLSLSQCTYYLAAINAPEDIQTCIREGQIKNLDKAALVAGVDSVSMRESLIDACIDGASVKQLRKLISQQKAVLREAKQVRKATSAGRKAKKINMGSTETSAVVHTIIDCVVKQKGLDKQTNLFDNINWDDLRQVSKAFKQLVNLLEHEMAV